MKKIKDGDSVSVHYTGRLESGEVFDSSKTEGRVPLQVTLGQGQLIKGFESALMDMSIGETKTTEIESSEAYGEFMEELIQEVPKTQMPGDVEVGTQLQAQTEMGPVQFVVREVKEETVVLDANHPLAGQKLIFDLEVVDIH